MRSIGRLLFCLLLSMAARATAGELDDYYLSRFGALPSTLAVGLDFTDTGQLPRERCGAPLIRGLRQDWPRLQTATQVVLAKQLSAPVLDSSYLTAHFAVHYATTGVDAFSPPAGYATALSWVQQVGATFEDVYFREVTQLGYKDPVPAGGRFHVYLQNVGSQYLGVTDSAGPTTQPYITVENDFAEFLASGYSPTQLLQITAAHEFHHAIQFAYTFWFDMWYAEATATWVEDEVYDGVNQLYAYLPESYHFPGYSLNTAVSVDTGGGYGRWIFNRYLAESYGVAKVREMWEAIDGAGSGADINMLPYLDSGLQGAGSSLAELFFGFTKQMYRKEWISHVSERGLFPALVMANYASYPVNAQSSTFPGGTLQPYSFAAFSFAATAGTAPARLDITLGNRSAGIRVALFQELSSGAVQELTVDQGATTLTVPSFNAGAIRKLVLLMVNTAATTGSLSFSTDGTLASGELPAAGTGGAPSPVVSGNQDSGGGGCFVATAAYGSYLHPKVQVLRRFRDRYLLSHDWGRAFVKWYYGWSPDAAMLISDRPLLRTTCRGVLAPLVFVLESPLTSFCLVMAGGLIGFRRWWRRRVAAACR